MGASKLTRIATEGKTDLGAMVRTSKDTQPESTVITLHNP